jgi:hypothetical protein
LECVLFETDLTCQRYELEVNAYSLNAITGCDPADVAKVQAKAVDLSAADSYAVEVAAGGSTALVLVGVAAVGSSLLSDLTVPSVEECLAACSIWMLGCTHVTVGAISLHMHLCCIASGSGIVPQRVSLCTSSNELKFKPQNTGDAAHSPPDKNTVRRHIHY